MKKLSLPPKRLEASIEDAFVRGAKKMKCELRKMNGLGFRDWPDRLVLGPRGFFAWYEFKRPGKAPRPSQDALFSDLAALGHTVYVFDDVERALGHLEASLKAHGRKK